MREDAMRRFVGHVVWITGGGSGIGRALALEFAQEGASIAISGRRAGKLAETVREIERLGARGIAVPCDVTEASSTAEAVRQVVETFGALDVVVANAGYSVMGRIEDLDPTHWKRQFEVNFFGLINTVQAALPELRKKGGRIVLIGSVAAFLVPPKGAVYSASKAAVRMVGEAFSQELRGSGVSCTTVHPAYVETDIVRVDNDGRLHPERKDTRPRWLVWKADRAAKKVVEATYRRRREVVISAYGKFVVNLSRFLPGLLRWILGLGMTRKGKAGVSPTVKRIEMIGEPRRMVLHRSPGTIAIYLRSFRWMGGREQGSIPQRWRGKLLPIEVSQPGVKIDSVRLVLFRKVCENPTHGLAVPPAFLECLFLGPMAEVVLSETFPLSPFGLIHVRQRIAMLRPIDPNEPVDLFCRLDEFRETDRGIEVDFGLHAIVAGSDVWNGTTTVLSRNRAVRSGSRRSREKSMVWIPKGEAIRSFFVRVPEDTGRRYARASGDWNPHHLYPATARLLGYRRAIAHGMWTLARTLALIESERSFVLPIEAEATFKRPIFLPSEVAIRLLDQHLVDNEASAIRFEVCNAKNGELHMIGSVKTG